MCQVSNLPLGTEMAAAKISSDAAEPRPCVRPVELELVSVHKCSQEHLLCDILRVSRSDARHAIHIDRLEVTLVDITENVWFVKRPAH